MLNIKAFESIERIQKADWGQFPNPGFPFVEYEFFKALETSNVVGGESGWNPQYLTLWDNEKLVGVSYLYEKWNSYGEYIFDWTWAEAYHRHRVAYFPKLTSAIPFTPATGPKLLFHPSAHKQRSASLLLKAAKKQAEAQEKSSLHYLFVPPDEVPYFEGEGFLIRHSFQYHWKNQNYENFDHFLDKLKPKKRKQILREREQLKSSDIQIRWLTGQTLLPEHALLFYQFYIQTIEKMGAISYLNQEFFQTVFETLRDEVILILAEEAGVPVAGALYYQKGPSLFGRYWGALKEIRNLHFELCYYQPVIWAIENKIQLFEAGAQGEHKISRGFLPELTYSAHWIRDPEFSKAIQNFIEEEKRGIRGIFEQILSHSPFR